MLKTIIPKPSPPAPLVTQGPTAHHILLCLLPRRGASLQMVVIETPALLAPSSMMVSAAATGPDLPLMLPLLVLPPARLLNRDIGTLLLLLSCDASRENAPPPVLTLDLERLRLRPRLSSIECVGSRGVVGGGGPWSTDRLVGREKL